jgi:hypothetical protein
LVIRSLERDLPTEAAWAYHNFTLLPLVEALRMAYCPNRFDFGLRYLRDDLPREEYQRVCQLALPGGMEGIRSAREEAEAWFGRVVDRLVGPTVP